DRLFRYLNDDVLAALQQILNRRRLGAPTIPRLVLLIRSVVVGFVIVVVAIAVVVGKHEVGGVQERTLLRPDVDERGLDAGKYGLHASQINIADHAPSFRPVDE